MTDTAARAAWGWGLATVHQSGQVLDTWFAAPALGRYDGAHAPLMLQVTTDARRGVRTDPRVVEIDLDVPPATVPDAYLRLHLLSHRLVKPREVNLDGIFGVDKFPRMVDYVVPSGVRIADADRVRLGAYLSPGTTVMHAGFVNYNAGTLGVAMIEGRVSQGVVIGDGSDVGGGASIMGTLSGGGRERVSLGRHSLLGANSGLGIPLGDDCVVEAGLYLTAGTKVTLRGVAGQDGRVVAARELAGSDGLLFRRNSVTGAVEASARSGIGVRLNSALHAN